MSTSVLAGIDEALRQMSEADLAKRLAVCEQHVSIAEEIGGESPEFSELARCIRDEQRRRVRA